MMLFTIQLSLAMAVGIGLGGWWVARSLTRPNLEEQIKLILDALDIAQAYWSARAADPTASAYAENVLLHLHLERREALEMRAALDRGERLTVKQLIRLDKLVSKHLAAFVTLGLAPTGR